MWGGLAKSAPPVKGVFGAICANATPLRTRAHPAGFLSESHNIKCEGSYPSWPSDRYGTVRDVQTGPHGPCAFAGPLVGLTNFAHFRNPNPKFCKNLKKNNKKIS